MTAPPASFICPITQDLMTDPVIGSDGITYERAAIEAWFATGAHTSPLTRAPMSSRMLTPNIALRSLIQEWNPPTAVLDPAPVPPPAPPAPTIQLTRYADAPTLLKISITQPESTTLLPMLFIDILDISASMGSPAADSSRHAEAAVFSRADLVRHAVATQIELLRPEDQLAVVLFDNTATVALPPTKMAGTGRLIAKACLPQIAPRGGTNIWAGLQRALQLAAAAPADTNIAIILQTDGESDPALNPPRGITATLQSWCDNNPDVAARITLHTVGYGFGCALDMPLLRSLADAVRGTTNYIPDGSMVGTVFIHLMANLMSLVRANLVLHLPDIGEATPIPFLQSGQTVCRFVSLADTDTAVAVSLTANGTPVAPPPSPPITVLSATTDFDCAAHNLMVRLAETLERAEAGHLNSTALTDAATSTLAAVAAIDPAFAALQTDLSDPDPARGQLSKAFASPDAFQRWGRHYIPGVISSLQYGWAINFKDALSRQFGTATTRGFVDRGDTIFTALPPPIPSCQSYSSSTAPITIASVHNASGGCFLGDGLVLMADGSERRVDSLVAGDRVHNWATIVCVIKMIMLTADIVRLGNRDGVGITMWHPFKAHDGYDWQFPADCGIPQCHYNITVYNFVLDSYHILTINGIDACTLGHNISGPVIGHPYFGMRESGKRNVRDDLEADPGWASGSIAWEGVEVDRDPDTGLVCGMRPAGPRNSHRPS